MALSQRPVELVAVAGTAARAYTPQSNGTRLTWGMSVTARQIRQVPGPVLVAAARALDDLAVAGIITNHQYNNTNTAEFAVEVMTLVEQKVPTWHAVKIQWIKEVRTITNLGLKGAKDFADAVDQQYRQDGIKWWV